jgi:hypothetical protein
MTTQALDVSRGTAMWAFNLFRQDALSQLLKDLLAIEKLGIDDEKCEKVQTSLREISIAASAIPDGTFFSKAIWKEVDDFKDVYIKWNNVKGVNPDAIESRKQALKELKAKRHKIARKTRKHQHVLAFELDLAVVDSMYTALNNLVLSVPGLFNNLAGAVGRFESRKKG